MEWSYRIISIAAYLIYDNTTRCPGWWDSIRSEYSNVKAVIIQPYLSIRQMAGKWNFLNSLREDNIKKDVDSCKWRYSDILLQILNL